MARGQTIWSKDLRDIIDTAISIATAVEIAVSQLDKTRALHQNVPHGERHQTIITIRLWVPGQQVPLSKVRVTYTQSRQ